jgi:NarL family two-component system response regulator LiaR
MLADDHEIVRRGLRMTIMAEADLLLVGEARDGNQAIQLAESLSPDLILMDVQMPGCDGIAATQAILAKQPQAVILILTSYAADAQVHAALRAGAKGYLLKDLSGDALLAAIRGAVLGNPQLHPQIAQRLIANAPLPADPLAELTIRERDVLRLIGKGLSNKEIATTLTLSDTTVKGYVSEILAKLQVADRTQAALLAVRYGLVPAE